MWAWKPLILAVCLSGGRVKICGAVQHWLNSSDWLLARMACRKPRRRAPFAASRVHAGWVAAREMAARCLRRAAVPRARRAGVPTMACRRWSCGETGSGVPTHRSCFMPDSGPSASAHATGRCRLGLSNLKRPRTALSIIFGSVLGSSKILPAESSWLGRRLRSRHSRAPAGGRMHPTAQRWRPLDVARQRLIGGNRDIACVYPGDAVLDPRWKETTYIDRKGATRTSQADVVATAQDVEAGGGTSLHDVPGWYSEPDFWIPEGTEYSDADIFTIGGRREARRAF